MIDGCEGDHLIERCNHFINCDEKAVASILDCANELAHAGTPVLRRGGCNFPAGANGPNANARETKGLRLPFAQDVVAGEKRLLVYVLEHAGNSNGVNRNPALLGGLFTKICEKRGLPGSSRTNKNAGQVWISPALDKGVEQFSSD